MKGKLSAIIRILISGALILILFYAMRGKYTEILDALKSVDPGVFLFALCVFMAAIILASIRLKLLIKIQDIHLTLPEAVSLNFIGYFFNNFLPTAIGGDVIKAYYLSKKTKKKMSAYTSVFVDRAIGLFTMIFMAFVALLFAKNRITDQTVKYAIYGITLVSFLAILFMTNKKFARIFFTFPRFLKPLEERLKRAYDLVHHYKHFKMLMFQSLTISFLSQLLFFLSLGILMISIGSRVSWFEILLRTPIISALSLLPSINGLGVREGSTIMLFGPIIGKEKAFAVSILWLVILLITSILGGIVYGSSRQFRIKIKEVEGKELPI